jgi:small-conductance mechanosensitive channel
MNIFNFQEFVIGHGIQFISILFILLVGIAVYLALSRLLIMLFNRQAISESMFRVFRKITKTFVFVVIILFSLQQLGVKVSTIVASLLTVAAMIAIGFIAIWSVLSNFLCSFLIILFTPFRIGDEI